MDNICDSCNKKFVSKSSLNRHKKKKIPCGIKRDNNYECKYCRRNYANQGNLNKHMNICKIKQNDKKEDVIDEKDKIIEEKNKKIEEMEELLNQFAKNMEDMKKEIKEIKINNTNNNNVGNTNNIGNTNNNTIINNYNFAVNDYNKPNIEDIIRDGKQLQLKMVDFIKDNRVNAPAKMVGLIWGDINKPENHSMLLTNPRSDYMLVMKDSEWRHEEVNKVLKFLHAYSYQKVIDVLRILHKNEPRHERIIIPNIDMLIASVERNFYDANYYDENLKHFIEELLNIRDKVESTVMKDKKNKKLKYEQEINKVIEQAAQTYNTIE